MYTACARHVYTVCAALHAPADALRVDQVGLIGFAFRLNKSASASVCTAGARPRRLHHVLDPQDARPRAAALQGHLRRALRPRGALHAAAAAAPAAAHHRLHPRAQAQEDCGGGGRGRTMRT